MNNIHISNSGLSLIARFEGVVLHIYKDIAGIETVGIGHVVLPAEKQSGIFANGITRDQALQLLAKDAAKAENIIKAYIKVELNQNQFDALVSMVFNCGGACIISGGLGKVINASQFDQVALEMAKWSKVRNPKTGALEVNAGLLGRRNAESGLFAKPMADAPDTDPGHFTDDEKQQILNSVSITSNTSLDDYFHESDRASSEDPIS